MAAEAEPVLGSLANLSLRMVMSASDFSNVHPVATGGIEAGVIEGRVQDFICFVFLEGRRNVSRLTVPAVEETGFLPRRSRPSRPSNSALLTGNYSKSW